jgi:hypothetical protein
MTVVTPAIYQAFAEEGLGPPLEPYRGPERLSLSLRAVRALFARNLAAALKPESVRRIAAEGGTGIALFDEDELRSFVSEAEEAPPDQPRRGRWWEFWPTREGSYAMFPGDDSKQRSIAGTLWIPAEGAARVRRVELRSLLRLSRSARLSALASGGPPLREPPFLPPEPCELRAEEREPGAPYVGSCSDVGCDRGCSPHVVVHPDDGIHRLLGCEC